MAFAGEYNFGYSGFSGNLLKDLLHDPFGTIEQTVRPFIKAALPAIGAIVGSVVIPGVGTAVGATIGGAVTSVAQSSYETHKAKKEAEKAAAEATAQAETIVASMQVSHLPAPASVSAGQVTETSMQTAQAGFFSKPSNLAMAALAIGLIAYVPPLKKKGRGKGRKRARRY
jgi:hypothetical protein